jgi:hypothetical protein
MMLPTTERHYEDRDDACGARGAGQCHSEQVRRCDRQCKCPARGSPVTLLMRHLVTKLREATRGRFSFITALLCFQHDTFPWRVPLWITLISVQSVPLILSVTQTIDIDINRGKREVAKHLMKPVLSCAHEILVSRRSASLTEVHDDII